MDIILREAYENDINSIYNLFKQLWKDKKIDKIIIKKMFLNGIISDNEDYICLEKDKKVIGFCSVNYYKNFWQEGDIAYIQALIVDENNRSNGYGSLLIDKAINKARLLKCKQIELDSGFHRESAHLFYQKVGFEKRAYTFSKVL